MKTEYTNEQFELMASTIKNIYLNTKEYFVEGAYGPNEEQEIFRKATRSQMALQLRVISSLVKNACEQLPK